MKNQMAYLVFYSYFFIFTLKNPFASSGFQNLKPKVNQERNNSDNTENKNTKANAQDTKTTIE